MSNIPIKDSYAVTCICCDTIFELPNPNRLEYRNLVRGDNSVCFGCKHYVNERTEQLEAQLKNLTEANELYDKHWNAEKQSSAKAWLENKQLKELLSGFVKGTLEETVKRLDRFKKAHHEIDKLLEIINRTLSGKVK